MNELNLDATYLADMDARRDEAIECQDTELSLQAMSDRDLIVSYLQDILNLDKNLQSVELVPAMDDQDIPTTYLVFTLLDGSNYPEGNGFPVDGTDYHRDQLWWVFEMYQEWHRQDLDPYHLGMPTVDSLKVVATNAR